MSLFVETDYLVGRACVKIVVERLEARLFGQLARFYREACNHLRRSASNGHRQSQRLMLALTRYLVKGRLVAINSEESGRQILQDLRVALAA